MDDYPFSDLEDLNEYRDSLTTEEIKKMSDIGQFTGTIETRYNNDRKPAVNLVMDCGTRFSDYSGDNVPAEAQNGATVSFPYKVNGQYNNIAGKVTVVAPSAQAQPAPTAPPPAQQQQAPAGQVDKRQLMIMRQNAMGHAVNYCNKIKDGGYTPEEAITVAEQMLAWYQS